MILHLESHRVDAMVSARQESCGAGPGPEEGDVADVGAQRRRRVPSTRMARTPSAVAWVGAGTGKGVARDVPMRPRVSARGRCRAASLPLPAHAWLKARICRSLRRLAAADRGSGASLKVLRRRSGRLPAGAHSGKAAPGFRDRCWSQVGEIPVV